MPSNHPAKKHSKPARFSDLVPSPSNPIQFVKSFAQDWFTLMAGVLGVVATILGVTPWWTEIGGRYLFLAGLSAFIIAAYSIWKRANDRALALWEETNSIHLERGGLFIGILANNECVLGVRMKSLNLGKATILHSWKCSVRQSANCPKEFLWPLSPMIGKQICDTREIKDFTASGFPDVELSPSDIECEKAITPICVAFSFPKGCFIELMPFVDLVSIECEQVTGRPPLSVKFALVPHDPRGENPKATEDDLSFLEDLTGGRFKADRSNQDETHEAIGVRTPEQQAYAEWVTRDYMRTHPSEYPDYDGPSAEDDPEPIEP